MLDILTIVCYVLLGFKYKETKSLALEIKLTWTKKIVVFWPAPENSIEGIRARKTQLSSIKCEVRRRRRRREVNWNAKESTLAWAQSRIRRQLSNNALVPGVNLQKVNWITFYCFFKMEWIISQVKLFVWRRPPVWVRTSLLRMEND